MLAAHQDVKDQKAWSDEVLATIGAGLKAFGPTPPRMASATTPLPHRGLGVRPDGGVDLALTIRYVRGGGAASAPAEVHRESLWLWDGAYHTDGGPTVDTLALTKEEWATFAPAPVEAGAEWSVPESLARKFVRVLSPASDQSTMPRPDEAQAAVLKATVESVAEGHAQVRLEGTWKMRHVYDGKPSFGWATANGVIRYDAALKRPDSLLLVFDGAYRMVPPWDTQDRPIGALAEWSRIR